ncbi:hypothetical protein QL285_095917 [Trifolium repens]|nr:hypothetical protein QL285_095917 [Trifolium repens]
MAGNNNFHANLPVFDGKNWDRWVKQMKVIFNVQEVYEQVNATITPLPENANEEQRTTFREAKKKDNKALFLIHQCVDSKVFEKIADAETSKDAWDILQKSYGGDAKVKKVKLQALKRQYELLQMKNDESVADYFTRLVTLTNQMKNCGGNLDEQETVEKVLRTLTSKFEHIMVTIEETKDLSEIKIEDLQSTLEAHELKHGERSHDKEDEQALFSKFKKYQSDKKKWQNKKDSKKGKDHVEDDVETLSESSDGGGGKQKDKSKKKDKSKIQCYNCDKYGHYANECKISKKKKGQDSDEEANVAHDSSSSEDETSFMVIDADETADSMEWYFDSACSNHMTGNRSILSNFNECLNIKIKLANNEFTKAEGMGNVMIEMSNGKKAVIENVLLVPGMQCNLLSVGKLISKGFKIVIEDETLQLFDSKKRLILKTAQSKNRTYKTRFKAIGAECPPATVDNSQVISEGIGSILVKRNDGQEASITGVLKSNVISIDQLLEKNYSVKMHDKELKLVDAKDREILKAPMSNNKTFRMLNMLEHQCVVPTVNESQNWVWHHRYGHFHFRSLNLLNLKKIVNGPPQIKVQRQLRKECCVAKSTKKLMNKTPHKAWTGVRPWIGVRPSVGHFKVFGSLCLRHVPTHCRRKLEDRSQSMNFLGYHSAGAYKLYSPTRNKMVTCRDMQFVKAKSWSWSGNDVHQDVATSDVTSVPEKAMLVEAKPIDLDQAMNDSNWLEATNRKKYAEDILKRFKMVGCNASITLTDTMAKTEAEYVAGSLAACQANWLHSLLSEMSIIEDITSVLKIDNKPEIT